MCMVDVERGSKDAIAVGKELEEAEALETAEHHARVESGRLINLEDEEDDEMH